MKWSNTSLYTIATFVAVLSFSCSKQKFETSQAFGTLKFKDLSGITDLRLAYDELPYTKGSWYNVKVPAGKGIFSFSDPLTNKSLLDTALIVELNSTKQLILFKPGETLTIIDDAPPPTEPKPAAGYIKVKMANFASKALPASIDIVLYGYDDDLGDFVPLDTLKNISKQFPGNYITTKTPASLNEPTLVAKVMNSVTQEIITTEFPLLQVDAFDWSTSEFKSFVTFFLTDDENGSPVSGTPYKVALQTLFSY